MSVRTELATRRLSIALTGYRFITQLVDPVTAADPALFSKLEDSARRLIEEIKSRPTNSSSCVTQILQDLEGRKTDAAILFGELIAPGVVAEAAQRHHEADQGHRWPAIAVGWFVPWQGLPFASGDAAQYAIARVPVSGRIIAVFTHTPIST